MTPAVDYKKALEQTNKAINSLNWLVRTCAHNFDDEIQEKAKDVFDVIKIAEKQALQPCAEAMTEDDLVGLVINAETDCANSTYRHCIQALIQAGHLKVKA